MTTTVARQELFTAWDRWHAARELALREEHGWLSITGFHWLQPVPTHIDGLPGRWHFESGRAILEAAAADGLTLAEPGAHNPVDGTVSATVAEAGSLQWISHGDTIVELVLRGGRYAIRLRDPSAPERAAFAGVPAFPVDPEWIKPGRFTPADPRKVTVDTARDDLRQQITAVGTVDVEIAGHSYPLVATAGQQGRLNLSFTDPTNGLSTARWRVVSTSIPTETGSLVVDFNRTVNFPFSFTEFGTCPAPVPGNHIPVPVTAGEKAPIRVTGDAALRVADPQQNRDQVPG
jgi:hypothetical protein